MNVIKKIYQKILPENIRERLTLIRGIPKNYLLKRKIISSLKNDCRNSNDKEKQEVIEFLKFNSLCVFPYSFTYKYKDLNSIEVFSDKDGYRYFIYDGKKYYGKRKWRDIDFQRYFQMIFIEQDKNSPHCYFSRIENKPDENDIVADIGAAEGWFAMQVVDIVKKVYCFEADPDWIEPLRRTIAPYKDKIELVEQYVGGESEGTVSLDEFFRNKEITYVKADIEGYEKEMLRNAEEIFTKKIKKSLLVMYHNQEDEAVLTNIMKSYGFRGIANDGYILLFFSPGFKPPYVRKGVVCFDKVQS